MKPLKFISHLFKATSSTVDTIQFGNEARKRTSESIVEDLGVFRYSDIGFNMDLENEFHSINWTDIERLVAYKVDLMTTDEVCMDIIYGNKTITVTEETRGWYQFIKKIKSSLLNINQNWEAEVVKSPFEYDFTTIYDRGENKMPLK